MRLRGLLVVLVLFGPLSLRAQKPSIQTVERLCGYLQQEKRIPDSRRPNFGDYEYEVVEKSPVKLYAMQGDSLCCSNTTPVALAVSRKGGKFEFKEVPPGKYWLVAIINQREYKMQIEYQPPKESPDECNEHLYTLDKSGNFVLLTYITVT